MHKLSRVVVLFSFLALSTATFAEPKINPAVANATGSQPLALQITTIIKDVLSSGYPLIKEIELKDGAYRVKALNSQGIDIELIVDPQSGTILKPKTPSKIRFSLIDAITQVAAKGYRGIYRIEADDGSYDVYAIDANGSKVTLEVDAITGEVSKSWF